MFTTEQATLAAAVIAAIAVLISLLVNVFQWRSTQLLKKRLADREFEADFQKESRQLVIPNRVEALRAMKKWLEDGSSLFNLVNRGSAEKREIDDWIARGTNFLSLAKREDPNFAEGKKSLASDASRYYYILI